MLHGFDLPSFHIDAVTDAYDELLQPLRDAAMVGTRSSMVRAEAVVPVGGATVSPVPGYGPLVCTRRKSSNSSRLELARLQNLQKLRNWDAEYQGSRQ